jgi:hypothetical protein
MLVIFGIACCKFLPELFTAVTGYPCGYEMRVHLDRKELIPDHSVDMLLRVYLN